jgi:hypothetical protein
MFGNYQLAAFNKLITCSNFLYTYITSAALRHVLMNYVALLWAEVSQPWFTRFREGCEDLSDDPRSGQLSYHFKSSNNCSSSHTGSQRPLNNLQTE